MNQSQLDDISDINYPKSFIKRSLFLNENRECQKKQLNYIDKKNQQITFDCSFQQENEYSQDLMITQRYEMQPKIKCKKNEVKLRVSLDNPQVNKQLFSNQIDNYQKFFPNCRHNKTRSQSHQKQVQNQNENQKIIEEHLQHKVQKQSIFEKIDTTKTNYIKYKQIHKSFLNDNKEFQMTQLNQKQIDFRKNDFKYDIKATYFFRKKQENFDQQDNIGYQLPDGIEQSQINSFNTTQKPKSNVTIKDSMKRYLEKEYELISQMHYKTQYLNQYNEIQDIYLRNQNEIQISLIKRDQAKRIVRKIASEDKSPSKDKSTFSNVMQIKQLNNFSILKRFNPVF